MIRISKLALLALSPAVILGCAADTDDEGQSTSSAAVIAEPAACTPLHRMAEGGLTRVAGTATQPNAGGVFPSYVHFTTDFFSPTRRVYASPGSSGMTTVTDAVAWSTIGGNACSANVERVVLSASKSSDPGDVHGGMAYFYRGEAESRAGRVSFAGYLDALAFSVVPTCDEWVQGLRPGTVTCQKTRDLIAFSGDCRVKATESALCKAVSGRVFEVLEGGKKNLDLMMVETVLMSPDAPGPAVQPPLRPVALGAAIVRATAPASGLPGPGGGSSSGCVGCR